MSTIPRVQTFTFLYLILITPGSHLYQPLAVPLHGPPKPTASAAVMHPFVVSRLNSTRIMFAKIIVGSFNRKQPTSTTRRVCEKVGQGQRTRARWVHHRALGTEFARCCMLLDISIQCTILMYSIVLVCTQ